MRELIDRTPEDSKAGLIIPWFSVSDRPTDLRLEESSGLVEALGCTLSFARTEQVRRISPSHLLPVGLLTQIGEDLVQSECNLLIVDANLSPVQQRNLERQLEVKVIDRTGLILEIFGLRARTKTGKLQVELARQLYERSRLVRTWTHLERQRGGRGFLSGPGESQLEADKRMLDRRVQRLRRDLEDVRRTRGLQRKGRARSGIPVIALVGYTNAGKSSLFNALSGASVLAKDMPFATLDPTIRRIPLPHIGEVALVDTVGFITDLPTHLIESFQATLEEALEADLLVHVRDRSSADDHLQKNDVELVLNALEVQSGQALPPMIEAWNKADLLSDDLYQTLGQTAQTNTPNKAVLLSAVSGDGLDELVALIAGQLRETAILAVIQLSPADGSARSWLHEHSDVRAEEVSPETGDIEIAVSFSTTELGQFQAQFPNIRLDAEDVV